MPARKIRVIKKRKEWVDQFKIPLVKGSTLNVSESIASRYAQRWLKLIDQMTRETRREVLASLRANDMPEDAAQDASPANQVQMVFNALMKKWDQAFGRIASDTAWKFIDDVSDDSEQRLKSSLKELSGDLTLDTGVLTGPLHDIIDATVKENVALIKRTGGKYLDEMQGDVMRSIQFGNGLQDLIPAFEKRDVQIRNWAQNVALDQTRKAFNGINAGRMEALGLDEYEWIHGGGSNHPREYHRDELDGKIFKLSDPPIIDKRTGERGKPGQLPFCRCTMRPVWRLPAGYHDDGED
jgi:SPP1 gp7 family putative phage head morphogenesis protein